MSRSDVSILNSRSFISAGADRADGHVGQIGNQLPHVGDVAAMVGLEQDLHRHAAGEVDVEQIGAARDRRPPCRWRSRSIDAAMAGPRQRTKSMCVSPTNCIMFSLVIQRLRSAMSKITRAT